MVAQRERERERGKEEERGRERTGTNTGLEAVCNSLELVGTGNIFATSRVTTAEWVGKV